MEASARGRGSGRLRFLDASPAGHRAHAKWVSRRVKLPRHTETMSELALIASLFGPLFVGLILHGLCIKFGWLRSLAVPIDRSARFRGRALFGANKTYRGVIAVALGSAAGYSLQSLVPQLQPAVFRTLPTFSLASLGFALGAAAMLGELPNSFLKRQFDIAPGAPGSGPAMLFFYVLDQVDFLLGAWLVVWPWVAPTPSRVFWSILFVLVVHQVISGLGAILGMRSSAR